MNPKFRKIITSYSKSEMPAAMNQAIEFSKRFQRPLLPGIDIYDDWEQYCWFNLTVNNTGKKAIEDYKTELDFEGEFQEAGTESLTFLISKLSSLM